MTKTPNALTPELDEKLSFNPSNGLIQNVKYDYTYSSRSNQYVRIYHGKKTYTAHRLMWEKFFGPIPVGYVVDHINGIKNDNRLENLRLATVTENAMNRQSANRNNTSGSKVPGVSYYAPRQKYRVTLIVDGKQRFYGYFDKLKDAEQQAILARRAVFTHNTL